LEREKERGEGGEREGGERDNIGSAHIIYSQNDDLRQRDDSVCALENAPPALHYCGLYCGC